MVVLSWIWAGYTIPKGWKVFASLRAVHLDHDNFKDARSFDPWRWQVSLTHALALAVPHIGDGIQLNTFKLIIVFLTRNSANRPIQDQQTRWIFSHHSEGGQGGAPGLSLLGLSSQYSFTTSSLVSGTTYECTRSMTFHFPIHIFSLVFHFIQSYILLTPYLGDFDESWVPAEEDKLVFFPTTRTQKRYPIIVQRREVSRTL